MKIDMALFPSIEGSATSDDGANFLLHVKRPTGGDLLLGFPHAAIPKIIEHAALQSVRGGGPPDAKGRKPVTAFKASGFQIGRGQDGETVLVMTIGAGGQLSFLMPPEMPGQLTEVLQKLAS